MIEFPEKMEDNYEESNNQADRINYLIELFMELRENIYKHKKNRYYWESHFSILSINIWAGQIKHTELQKKEVNLRNAISKVVKIIELKQQELKNLIKNRITYFTEQCAKFRMEGAKFTNKYLHAQREYTNENLIQDIRQFQQEYQKIHNKLPTFMSKLITLGTLCTLNNLTSVDETQEILKINIVLRSITKSNNSKFLQITFAQDLLKKLENEIKQKKIIFNNTCQNI